MKKILMIATAIIIAATSAYAGTFTLSPGAGYGGQFSSSNTDSSNSGFIFGVNGTYIVDRWLFDLGYGITTTADGDAQTQALTVGFGTVFGSRSNVADAFMGVKPRALAMQMKAEGEKPPAIYPYLLGGAEVDPTGDNLHGLFGEVGTMIPVQFIDQWTRIGARVAWLAKNELDQDYRISLVVAPVMAW